MKQLSKSILCLLVLAATPTALMAQNTCGFVSYPQLQVALGSVATNGANGGLNLNMWATIVNRDGEVCHVAKSGADRGDQWPGSRAISAQKANTANAFSLPGLALSTANLFSAVQPGGSLFGLQESNPVDTSVAYGGNAKNYGQNNDPMVGGKVGGVNVFGGGLPLYDEGGELLGAIGLSGDTSCTDHVIAWKIRDALGLDYVPGGVAPGNSDNIIFDVTPDPAGGTGASAGGFGHAACGINDPDPGILIGACPIGDGASIGCTVTDVNP